MPRRAVAIVPVVFLLAALPCPAGETILSFAWISDLHLDEQRIELAKGVFRWIDERLAPDFVLFTGDDNAIPAPPEDPASPDPEDLRRHRFFKDFLAEHLRAPAVLIPGDNWPGGFAQVFGAAQRSFDCSGLHFLLLGPDRTHKASGTEGLSALDEASLAWIREDLRASRGKPVIVAIHEPIHPPTFLDAPLLRRWLAECPQVIAVLQGHLHVGLHLQADGKAYITAPALGPAAVPAFKHVIVLADRLLVRTFARDAKTALFAPLGRDREIEVPPALRASLRRAGSGFRPENLSAAPSHPHIDDPQLGARKAELLRNLSGLLDQDVRTQAESPPAKEATPPPK